LKPAQNCASFDTLCGKFETKTKKFQLPQGAVVLFLRIKSQISEKPFNISENAFYKLALGFQVLKSSESNKIS
jgi:hypothetical protein